MSIVPAIGFGRDRLREGSLGASEGNSGGGFGSVDRPPVSGASSALVPHTIICAWNASLTRWASAAVKAIEPLGKHDRAAARLHDADSGQSIPNSRAGCV